jgi:hypothetical protein
LIGRGPRCATGFQSMWIMPTIPECKGSACPRRHCCASYFAVTA